ncbi:hypothetical protein [Streptomyces roseochromogenus]|uniref:Uncharacterized protein n=1 Tax=Streptomyces roseochromogenus subsp. oscitans DS 12.976 TaxID=1352936 RepID=V6KR64_STRRC|nr:hypothetical protein [Streptomyces roseochromogenus]EST34518.1 hypothetical protein M878_09995 [Streptomyces roseochromogenus subsp. oscitans DS 12.976]
MTTGGHVGHESWLERDRTSQPLWLHWREGSKRRRHAPDYAALSGRSTEVLAKTLVNAGPAAEPPPPTSAFNTTQR